MCVRVAIPRTLFFILMEGGSIVKPRRKSRKRSYVFEFERMLALMVRIRRDILKVSP